MATATGTVLKTGANGGLGSAFVLEFLKSPYAATHTRLFAVRDLPKLQICKKSYLVRPDYTAAMK
jgi:NAD(P)-dependent dehydrogenase (short-subunit alcohol dehydrogenase family)